MKRNYLICGKKQKTKKAPLILQIIKSDELVNISKETGCSKLISLKTTIEMLKPDNDMRVTF